MANIYTKLVAHTLFPLHERLMQRPTFDYLDELEKSQWLSRTEVEQLQMLKLKRLLQSAEQHSPWHAEHIRSAGLEPLSSMPLTLEALRSLPTMTKQDATRNIEQLVWRDIPSGAYKYNTGGSSGQPLIFYYGRLRQASDAAGRLRARRWWGVEVGDREVYLWGAPVELNKTGRIKTLRDRLLNQLVMNAFDMSTANMNVYIEAIQGFQPKCIYGYASSLALLAAHAADRGIKLNLPSLKVVCTTGEPLYPHQRKLIEEIFGVPAANEFGSRDIGFTAHESPDGQTLLMSESIILEILDKQGNPVAPGESGEAVMTGLCSFAQPFIRYRTGDVVRYSSDTCKTGRGLHVIGEVMGRTTDFVVRSDGTIMHALAVIYVLRATDGIDEFKFIQHGIRDVEILVVRNPDWSEQSHDKTVSGIQARLGNDVRIEIRFVDSIPPELSGKYRYVVSHVPLQSGLENALRESPPAIQPEKI
ncbi:phenylacetate--CoA ligase family protein [Candidatus Nitrotoga sp. M5]|uniref:phenylacetate--CoA ligase family protein n=1 Tax=Candidatus Nitrotoga sp. M5 TaxID=2890409 RepID=UPI001EF1BFBC|nr:phenylacetate--CoA ligase family protein [Candidatus Nitrotoga sp. M5]CAH1385707.1 Adenylyltransferase [Candidatus Nitrotoga sp. M5]